MKRLGLIAAIALCALPARGEQQQLATNVLHTLTPIDTLPTRSEIEGLFPPGTGVTQLSTIAKDADVDFGVRLRAIRALPQFCTPPCAGTTPHATLVSILQGMSPVEPAGRPILLLRATIEALGITRSGDPSDVNLLLPFLETPSRDIRAATAFALRDLCLSSAIQPLRNRYNIEQIEQVRLAISAALRDLATCP